MCGFPRPPFSPAPNLSTYCAQFVTRTGVLAGPAGANPTNAAMAVPTPSIGRVPLGTSSTYTPGDRYSGIRPPHRIGLIDHELIRVGRNFERYDITRVTISRYAHAHGALSETREHEAAITIGRRRRRRPTVDGHHRVRQRATAAITHHAPDVQRRLRRALIVK